MKASYRADGKDRHHVEIRDLTVCVYPQDGQWVAHCLDVDYAASGASALEAQQAFMLGFSLTIVEHYRRFQTIKKFLSRRPPEDVVRRLQDGVRQTQRRATVKPLEIPEPSAAELFAVPPQVSFYQAAA
jgi:hypothetical protein